MKKTILALSCFFSLHFAAQSQIVITEIMYNPPESNVDSLEFIELYNNGTTTVNLENWSMFGVVYTFPAVTMAPGTYRLIAANAAAVQNQFGVSALQWTGNALSNGGETIKLINSNGVTVDSVTYSNAAPWPTEANANGASLVLCDPNSDNALPGSWQAATTPVGITINGKAVFANPGLHSACSTTLDAKDDFFRLVLNNTITAKLPVLNNDFLPDPDVTVSIVSAPTAASATVNADQTISYTVTFANFCGEDQLRYSVCDNSTCDTATVDIFIPCYPLYTITQVSGENAATGVADSLNINCELQATVYGVNLRPINANQPALLFTLIDGANNGIAVSSLGGTFGYTVNEKDKVIVRGAIGQFNGQTEIRPDTIIKISENNPLIAPLVVVKPDESTESKLIKINNLHFVDPAEWLNDSATISGFNVRVVSDDHPQDTILLRIDRDVELFSQPIPPQPFNLTGIGGQFDGSSPYTTGYQILPRYNPDISTLVGVKEADFSAHVRLTPNPVSERLFLQTDMTFDRIRIFAASGILAKTMENPSQTQEIQVNDLPSGVYFIQFEKDGAAWATRFVKQ